MQAHLIIEIISDNNYYMYSAIKDQMQGKNIAIDDIACSVATHRSRL
jgi:hypothetical protein